jgi:hypothetical protein
MPHSLSLLAEASLSGDGLRTMLQQLAGNVFLAVLGLASLVFLFQRQFVRLAEFAVIGVITATFIYTPELWTGMGKAVAHAFGAGG